MSGQGVRQNVSIDVGIWLVELQSVNISYKKIESLGGCYVPPRDRWSSNSLSLELYNIMLNEDDI